MVEKASILISPVKNNTPETLVANVVQLTSLPSVYVRLEEVLKDSNHTRDNIADVISVDPALCARTLRIINSSYYALPNTVQNIATAINLIGEYDLRNIVLVTSVVNSVKGLVNGGIDITEFWRHSVRCGITAKLLAKTKSAVDPELFFLCGLLHDLGQLVILDNKISLEQQSRLTAILEATPDLISIADIDGFLTYLNEAGRHMLGIAKDENINKIRLADFHAKEDALLILSEGIPYAIEHGMWKSNSTLISKSSERILTSLVLITHKSEQGNIDFFSTVAKDIRSLRSAEETIKHLAYYDTLTGLANRNELLKQLEHEIDRVQRNKSHSALLYIDLDNFKYINDSLGHPTGDLVLKKIAQRLQSKTRGEDILARLGGDEFVVILTELSHDSLEALSQARKVTKKLNKSIAMDVFVENMTFNVTASIGISMFSAGTDNSYELLRFADTAMYEAKKAGKNQF